MYMFIRCLIMSAAVFGGGYAMIPVMEREFVEKRQFVTREDMADIIVLAQSLPGIISVNTVIIVGYKRAGFLGSIVCVLGILIPPLVIISLVTLAYTAIIENKYVLAVMQGVRAAVIALLAATAIRMIRQSVKDFFTIILLCVSFVLLLLNLLGVISFISPIYIILFGGALGIIYRMIYKKLARKKAAEKGGGQGGEGG